MKKLISFLVLMLAIVSMNAQMVNLSDAKTQRAFVQDLNDVATLKSNAQTKESTQRSIDASLQAMPMMTTLQTLDYNPELLREMRNQARAGRKLNNVGTEGPLRAPIPGPIPLLEGFEGTTGTDIPTGWFRNANPANDASTGAWMTGTANPRTGLRSANINLNAGANIASFGTLWSPDMQFEAGVTYDIEIWFRWNSLTGTTHLDYILIDMLRDSVSPADPGTEQTLFLAGGFNPSPGVVVVNPMPQNTWTRLFTTFTPTVTSDAYYLGITGANGRALGLATNQGGCIRIDDIKVSAPATPRSNDLAIQPNVFPFTQVPKSQIVPPFTAQISNIGSNAQTNVNVSAQLNGTAIGTGTAVSSLAAGATETFTVIPTTGTILVDTNTVNMTVSQTETDEDLTDNTASFTFIGTDHEYRVDNNTAIGGLGFSAAGTRFGNIFTITATTTINAVEVGFFNTTDAAGATDFQVAMWPMVGTTPNWSAPTFAAVTGNKPASFGGIIRVMVPATTLPPGNYFVAVVRSDGQLGLSVDGRAVSGRVSYVSANDSEFDVIANTVVGATFIRMIVDLPANDAKLVSIVSPTPGINFNLTNAEQVKVRVQNLGITTITSLPIFVELNGTPAFNQTFTTSIAPSATEEFVFTQTLNLSAEATYEIKVYTNLPSDADRTNDTLAITLSNMIAPPATIPYFQGFESAMGGNMLPAFWTKNTAADRGWQIIEEGVLIPGWEDAFATVKSGTRALVTSWRDANATTNPWAFSDNIPLENGKTYNISFWYLAPGYGTERDRFQVRIGTTNTVAAMATATSLFSHEGTSQTTVWTQANVQFTATADGGYYLGFRQTSATQNGAYIFIDDISIVETPANAMTVTTPVFPYTQIPTTQVIANGATFTARANNAGTADQTNVVLNVDLGGTSIATSTAATVTALTNNVTLTATTTAPAAIATGANTLTQTVSSDFYTGATAFTSTQTFEGTANRYATDDAASTASTSMNGAAGAAGGRGAYLGNIYEITEATMLRQIEIAWNNTTTRTGLELVLFQMNGDLTLGAPIRIGATTDYHTFNKPNSTFTWTLPAPALLQPGRYFVGVRQLVGSSNNTIDVRGDAVAGKTYYSHAGSQTQGTRLATGNNLTANISTTANGAPAIRMIMADACTAPNNVFATGTRPQTKLEWSSTGTNFTVNIASTTPAWDTTINTNASELLVTLPGNTAFTWSVSALCASVMTANGPGFTTDPDTVNFAMVSVTLPVESGANLGSYSPTVTIKNQSNTGLSYNSVAFEILVNGVSIGLDTTSTTNIAPGASQTYLSKLAVDLSVAGPYTIEAVIADIRDIEPADDTASVMITNFTRDAGVTEIVAVTKDVNGNWIDVSLTNNTDFTNLGATDSLRIKVKNLGQTDISGITLSATINGVHPHAGNNLTVWTADTDTLHVGEERYFTFPNEVDFMDEILLNTNAVGTYTLIAWATALPTDYNVSNDTMAIVITNQNFRDLEAVDILSPATGLPLSTTETVTVRIANKGTWATTGADAQALLYAENVLVATATLPVIAIGSSIDYVFTTPTFDLSIEGVYHFSVKVNYPGDQNSHNDSAYKTVTISTNDVFDAQVVMVLAPNDGEGLGIDEIVRVRVRNNGTTTLTNLPIFLQVNGGVKIEEAVPTLASNAFVDYPFTATANLSAAGDHNIVVWVELASDSDPSNDTARADIRNTIIIDAAVLTLVTPTEGILTDAEVIKVTVRNNGTFSTTNLPIFYQINGGTVVSDVVPTIAAKSAIDFSFATTANLSAAGPYNIVVWTKLPNDQNPSNDTLKETVLNTLILDMAVTSVTVPNATDSRDLYADAVPVTITVQNNGNTTQTAVPVFMTINGGTPVQVDVVTLAPTANTTLTTNVALAPGSNAIAAYVALANDINRANDTARASIDNVIDVRFNAFSAPATSVGTASQTVTVTLENRGTFKAKDVPVNLSLNGTLLTTTAEIVDSVNVYVSTGQNNRRTYSFTQQVTLIAGDNTIKVDVVLSNNTATATQITGTRDVIFSSCVMSLPWTSDFSTATTSAPFFPTCWERNPNPTGTAQGGTWRVGAVSSGGTGIPNVDNNGLPYAFILYNSTRHNAWFYTPGFQLEAGETYKFSFFTQMQGWDGEFEELAVFAGTEKTATGMTTKLWENKTQDFDNWTQIVQMFTPTTSEVYYFGFHATSHDVNSILVDKIQVGIPAANDWEIVMSAFPYTQIPASQLVASAQARNAGTVEQTNVKLSATLNGVAAGSSAPVASIAVGATSPVMSFVPSLSKSIPTGNHTMVLSVSGDQTNQGTSNTTAAITFTATEGLFAVDTVTNFGQAAGAANFTMGNIFEITSTTTLKQIVVAFGSADALASRVSVFRMTGATTTAATPILTHDVNRNATGFIAFDVQDTELTPGRYYVAITQTSATNLSVSYHFANGRPASWSRQANGNLGPISLEGGGAIVLGVRMVIGEPAVKEYTITATAGSGGTITPSGEIVLEEGESQTFAITPNSGYQISQVFVDGVNNPGAVTAGSYTFTNVTKDHTIEATFILIGATTFTITASAGTNGSINPSGEVIVEEGGSQIFTFTPITGFVIDEVLIGGVNNPGAVTAGSYTFTNVTANHTIAVTFKRANSNLPTMKSLIAIYPNPVQDVIYIQTDAVVKRIELINQRGQVVKIIEGSATEILVSNLPVGTYFVRITTDKGISTQRIVKN
jgi:hypothetical protein